MKAYVAWGFHMRRPGIGTYLAQGASANPIALALLWLGASLYNPQRNFVILFVISLIFLVLSVILGTIVACLLWLVESWINCRVRILIRVLTGIVATVVITLLLDLALNLSPESSWQLALSWFLGMVFPATLLCGTRFNPLRSVIFGLAPSPRPSDFGNSFSVFPGALLRLISVLGLFEALFYLAQLPSPAMSDSGQAGDGFLGALVAACYFGITALVAFGLPRKGVVLATLLITNVPIGMWTANLAPGIMSNFFHVVVTILVALWSLFTIGRLFAVETNRPRDWRILPVTFFEIRVRHALNHW